MLRYLIDSKPILPLSV